MRTLQMVLNILTALIRTIFMRVNRKKEYGDAGLLDIPSLKIRVPLYYSGEKSAQEITDDSNSAACLLWGGLTVIADHSHQGTFSMLNLAKEGKTVAVIDDGRTQKEYLCSSSQVGHLTLSEYGNELYDAEWAEVFGQNDGGLCIYTCIAKSARDVMDVRLTFWVPYSGAQTE